MYLLLHKMNMSHKIEEHRKTKLKLENILNYFITFFNKFT